MGEKPSCILYFFYICSFFSKMVRYIWKYTRIKKIGNKILHKFISIRYSCKCNSFYVNHPASRNTSGGRWKFIIMLSTTHLNCTLLLQNTYQGRKGASSVSHSTGWHMRVSKCAIKFHLNKLLSTTFVSSQIHLYPP